MLLWCSQLWFKEKPIRNRRRRSRESYAIFAGKSYNYHLITDFIKVNKIIDIDDIDKIDEIEE